MHALYVLIKHGSFSNYTLYCRSMLHTAPAFSSSETISHIPFLTAIVSADSPSCVMTDMCSETLMTSQKSLYIHNFHCKKVHNSRCNSTPSEWCEMYAQAVTDGLGHTPHVVTCRVHIGKLYIATKPSHACTPRMC